MSAGDRAFYALSRGGAKALHLEERQLSVFGPLHDRRGERMFARALQACNQLQELLFADAGLRKHGVQCRLAFGERAGLIDDQGTYLAEGFKRLCIPDQDARAGSATCADHDRHGRCEPECAGASDDQHRDRVDQGVGKARLRTQGVPDDESDDGCRDNRRNEEGRDAVRKTLDGGAGTLCLADHLDDLREQCVGADSLGPHHEAARSIHGSTRDFRVDIFFNGNRFAADYGLVNRAMSLEHYAVHGNFFAWPHAQPVADEDLIEQHVRLTTLLVQSPGGLRSQAQERTNRASGLAAGA